MSHVYKVSCSVKVQQMEAKLSHRISALKAQIQENGFPRGAALSRCYSSVLPPKDMSFFRAEREHVLRRGLQVAEALPVQSSADIMQRELESCLSLEYTPDSLPLVLLQFYTDRSYHLAQIKYLLMLRWRRFCRHASVIEKLYPHYKDQVSHLTSEYEDAVQRARRLSVSRETILTGRGNTDNLLTQEDVIIYLRWLVCHLHSVQTIHTFLRVLHHIPACERRDNEPKASEETSHKTQHPDGQTVPLHTTHLEEFLPELQMLIDHFHLSYDTQNLRTTADEMELFSKVWREFREIFSQQEEMKTFPQYDGMKVKQSQWGRKSLSQALKKEANWIPFIQVKPKPDPWQQKLITKLKEKKCVDELLKMQSKFLQVSDVLSVAAALREHAANVGDAQPKLTSSPSVCSNTKRHQISEIWTSVYSSAALTQETDNQPSTSGGTGSQERKSLKSQGLRATRVRYSLEERLQLLGLDDTSENGVSDPVTTKGAYMSLIYLRHLKLRQLQRISLGLLNYLRSVERTLTFDLAGLQREEGELCCTAEETGWMNAARGGGGEAGCHGSFQFSFNTPVDYRIHCSEFMEFPEVENLHDFYSTEGRWVHTQDQRGFYIVYDVALKDLQELEDELLLISSHFIHRDKARKMTNSDRGDMPSLAGTDVDRVAVLLDLWTCEVEFLENKVELLNCYYEAYQHTVGTEERFILARVITDIMHSRPHLDLTRDYFVQVYRDELECLRSHQQLIKNILDTQIDNQRQYLQRIWRDDHKGSFGDYGLLPNYTRKNLVSLGGSSSALPSVFLLEVHPSLCLASAVYHGLADAHAELCQLHRATSSTHKLRLRQKLLRWALQSWSELPPPGASYSPQIQKDLFSGVVFEDPILVQNMGLSLVRSGEEMEMLQGREKQAYAVETFSKLLELVTIWHRLLESASETAHLAHLYRNVATELSFDDCHLYMRPIQFEAAEQKYKTEQKPVFITAVLEDDSCVDSFTPSHLPLSIQELDENQIGRFSFSSEESVTHLLNRQSLENLQVTLACQVTQKHALMSAVKLACLCHWAERAASAAESEVLANSDKDVKNDTEPESNNNNSSLPEGSSSAPSSVKRRLMEAFVSIQLEKVGLRDEMLNSFMEKKRALGGFIKTPEEAAKIKRRLIIDYLRKFSSQISQYCVRAQIVAYYYSLSSVLEEIPVVRKSHFTMGKTNDPRITLKSEGGVCPDSRTSHCQQQQLMSADGKTLQNLWFIPHFSEVLHMLKTLPVPACASALHHALLISSALHDIVLYLVSFSRLGNTDESISGRRQQAEQGSLSADWGGTEGIGAKLQEIQDQVERLSDPRSPQSVSRLLQLHRNVLLLQFDTAVRQLIREGFLSSGDVTSYQSVSDNMVNALPLLSDSIQPSLMSLMLPVPRPLQARDRQAQRVYPWRSFLACHGLFPLSVWDVPPIEYCMQLCLSGLSDRSRLQANAAILGVSLLMEDVLNRGQEAGPIHLYGNKGKRLHNIRPDEEGELSKDTEEEDEDAPALPLQDQIRTQSVLWGFLLLMKQLQVFKESWARARLGVQVFTTPSFYQQFLKLYRAEIFYPSMRALARHMGTEQDYEALVSGSQSLLPPPGASEVDVKTWQLHKLLESTECDMIKAVHRRICRETTLVFSEETHHNTRLPTDLWKKSSMKHSLSSERPQIVETFIHQLMEGAEEVQGQVCVSKDLLQQSLTQLSCSVMERERRSFLLHSQFYEQILQQDTQLLHHKEQDLKHLKDSQISSSQNEISALCRGLMLKISALQAQVVHQEEEMRTQEERLSLKIKEEHESLVRHLCCTCIRLKGRLDEQHLQMQQDVSEMVSRVRDEGVNRIIKLKKKYGCSKDNNKLMQTKSQKEEVHELQQENRRLSALICKLKTLSLWKQLVDQEKLHRQLLQAQQREISSRSEALRVKMRAEEEVILLQEELEAVRKELSCSQAESIRNKKLLDKKTEELRVARHQSVQDARSRQELDVYRKQTLEQMRVDMEERERQLKELSEQLDKGSKMNQIHRQRSAKEIRQVKDQLQRERSFKQEAFQRVDRLRREVSNMEAALPKSSSASGQSRTYYTLSVSRLSVGSPSAGLPRVTQQSALQPGSLTNNTSLQDLAAEQHQQRAERVRSRPQARIERPRADPTRLRVLTAEKSLPTL